MGYRGMGHMGNEAHRGYGVQGYEPHGQQQHRGYGVQGVWATWAIGHMANAAHGQWGLWAMGPMGPWVIGTFLPIASLLLDGFLQKFYWTYILMYSI